MYIYIQLGPNRCTKRALNKFIVGNYYNKNNGSHCAQVDGVLYSHAKNTCVRVSAGTPNILPGFSLYAVTIAYSG